jgi:hypothetical protein
MEKYMVHSHFRLAPVKHKVKPHIREGKKVHSYQRGTRIPTKKELGIKITGKPQPTKTQHTDLGPAKAWIITFTYKKDPWGDDDEEKVNVFSDNYADAEAAGWKMRKYQKRTPEMVTVDDPDLIGMINTVRKSDLAQRFHTEMLKGASKNLQSKGLLGRVIAGKLGEEASDADFKRETKRAKQLLDDAFSDNKSTRTLARSRLKREFPELAANADWSSGASEQAHLRKMESMKLQHQLSGGSKSSSVI